jgi:hypothetical protein
MVHLLMMMSRKRTGSCYSVYTSDDELCHCLLFSPITFKIKLTIVKGLLVVVVQLTCDNREGVETYTV